jgi:outer membrane protein assembly factor BamD
MTLRSASDVPKSASHARPQSAVCAGRRPDSSPTSNRNSALPGVGRWALCVVLGVGAAIGSGCGGGQATGGVEYAEAAEEAYMLAERSFSRNDFEGARSRYSEIYQQYPYSQYAALAEVRVADCYYEERSFELARATYDRFVQLHPTHEEVPRAAYRVAVSYVRQVPGSFVLMPPNHERDLTQARNAYLALGAFLRTYAGSEFEAEAIEERHQVEDILVSHELYVAQWNLRHRNALGAARRAAFVLSEYPAAGRTPDALFVFARAMLEMGDVAQASAALRRLTEEYGDSEAGVAAQAWLTRWGL